METMTEQFLYSWLIDVEYLIRHPLGISKLSVDQVRGKWSSILKWFSTSRLREMKEYEIIKKFYADRIDKSEFFKFGAASVSIYMLMPDQRGHRRPRSNDDADQP